MRHLRLTAVVLVIALALEPTVLLAVVADKAAYFGGSNTPYASAKEPIEAELGREHVAVIELGQTKCGRLLPLSKRGQERRLSSKR